METGESEESEQDMGGPLMVSSFFGPSEADSPHKLVLTLSLPPFVSFGVWPCRPPSLQK